jgi:drug/metabolite transporter (DMT)-like permease
MSILHSMLALVCVIAISFGQILFKTVSIEVQKTGTWFSETVLLYAGSALVLYGGATLLWIYLLRFVELSRAYPVMAMSFVIVPIFSSWLFGDRLSGAYLGGVLLITVGVIVIARAS